MNDKHKLNNIEKLNLDLFTILMKVEVFCKNKLIEVYKKNKALFNKDIIENQNIIVKLINESSILNILMKEYFIERNQSIQSTREVREWIKPKNTPAPQDHWLSSILDWIIWGIRKVASLAMHSVEFFEKGNIHNSKQTYEKNIKFIRNSKNKIKNVQLCKLIINNYDRHDLKNFFTKVDLKTSIQNGRNIFQLVQEYNDNLEINNNKLNTDVEYKDITNTFIENVIILLDFKDILDFYSKNISDKDKFVLNKIRNEVCHFDIVMGKYEQESKHYLKIVLYIGNKIIPDEIAFNGDEALVKDLINTLFFEKSQKLSINLATTNNY